MNTLSITTLFILLISCSIAATSQKVLISEVHLKDGSVLKGQIIEDSDYYIRIYIPTLDTIQIGYKNIDYIGAPPKRAFAGKNRDRIVIKDKGWMMVVSNGYNYLRESDKWQYAPEFIIGNRLGKKINVGLSLGYTKFQYLSTVAGATNKIVALSGYGRYYFLKKKRVFVDGQVGYGFALAEESNEGYLHQYKGGLHTKAGIGYHFHTNSDIAFLLRAGMGYQRVSGDIDMRWGNLFVRYTKKYIYPGLSLALEF